jgi:feruloyl esterase
MATDPSSRGDARARLALMFSLVAASALPAACGGSDSSPAPAPVAPTCDDTMKTAFMPDTNTTVLLVKAFKRGDAPTLGTATTPVAICGIGIEICMPASANWNQKIHNYGRRLGWRQPGFAHGTRQQRQRVLAGIEGSVVGSTAELGQRLHALPTSMEALPRRRRTAGCS